ncbi:MAG TPA: hypothetical protein VH062_25975 [Polyangiaceae bacterium]|jgi:hypothetical protein|nr:hypothetical protein [Polyangiaceae bacterium]
MGRLFARAVGFLGFAVGVALVPRLLCSAGTGSAYAGDRATEEQTARAVDGWIRRGFGESSFATGSALFDEEWIFGTYQMAALGFGQVALEHPEEAALDRERMERAMDRMLAPAGHQFDTAAWHHDGLAGLDGLEAHAAFFGYANLVLSLHRKIYGESKYSALNDRMTAALVRRYVASRYLPIETYPGETYPVDNTAGIASIALHAKATGKPEPVLAKLLAAFRLHSVDAKTGLLIQSLHHDGSRLDAPRGSGTTLGAYFMSFGDPAFSYELHTAVQRELATRILGFRVVSEYPSSVVGGKGDIDSGPLLFGYSVSATGFAIAACRIHRDETCYRELLSTANLFGVPFDRGDAGRTFVAGGPLGDAILFAMQTAHAGVA